MTDYSLPLVLVRKLISQYEHSMLKRDYNQASQIAHDIVEMSLKLQDLANES